jgi:hypothetical protein
MQRLLEISILVLGGCSLFVVAFVGFAAASGVPMKDVAIVGHLFDEDPAAEEPAHAPEPEPVVEEPRSDAEVIQANLGVLATYRLPSPFDAESLEQLSDELRAKLYELERREDDVAERERHAAEREDAAANQLVLIDGLRAELEREAKALEQRAQAIAGEESVKDAREQAADRSRAELFATGDAEELAPRLLQFPPEEASRILRALPAERAKELLDALPTDDWKAYAEAYARGTD